jgi:hypothetical protein
MSDRSKARRRVLLLFVDGVGVGPADPSINPLASGSFPAMELTVSARPRSKSAGEAAMAHGIDASLGIPGLPQSATGQTALLTGVNSSAALGHHASGLPGPTLKRILSEHSLLKRLAESGRRVSFLNAFGPRFFDAAEPVRRLSATTLATMASGTALRDLQDLSEARAVTHDLTHWRMRDYGYDLPPRSPEEAGVILAREAMQLDFSMFEYFETDRAGHAQDRAGAERCLGDLNAALEAILEGMDLGESVVLVASDHGNMEDERVKTHTMNPAFFAAWGALDSVAPPTSLLDIAPLISGIISGA